MNWIERLYEIKGRDLYSQNGEGLILEYIFEHISIPYRATTNQARKSFIDIGGGDGFYLSNTRHLIKNDWLGLILDKENNNFVMRENLFELFPSNTIFDLLSIDIDGNDYWIIEHIMNVKYPYPPVIIAEFNPAFGDSRTIKYNPDHVWDGTDYYGFSFHAGVKLAEANGYKVIFQIADMNMIMVREDLIKVPIPPITFKLNNFFKQSERPESDWVFV